MCSLALQQPFAGQVIAQGNFYPSQDEAPAAELLKYKNFGTGAIICVGYPTFYGGHYGWMLDESINEEPPEPARREIFALMDMQADEQIRQLVAVTNGNLKYVVVTFQEEEGLLLWPSRVPRNFAPTILPTGPYGAPFSSPRCPDGPFSVRPGTADCNILPKYFAAGRKYGVEVVPYLNLIGNWEVFNRQFNYQGNSLVNHPRYDQYLTYQCRLVQELLLTYPRDINYLWYDNGSGSSGKMCQAMYNAARAIKPDLKVIGNNAGRDFAADRLPTDMLSIEQFELPPFGNNTSYTNTRRTYAGRTYPNVFTEFVLTPCHTPFGSQWYDYNQAKVFLKWRSPYPVLTFNSVSDFQATVDLGKTAGCPVLMDVMIGQDGRIVPQVLDYMAQINFAR